MQVSSPVGTRPAFCAGSCPAARAPVDPFLAGLLRTGGVRQLFPHARRVSRRPSTCGLPALCRRHTWAGVLVSFQGCSERLCENPNIANRVPTGGQDRAPAMYSGPTSGSIRASLEGQVPTGPTFHTVWRGVRQHATSILRRRGKLWPEAFEVYQDVVRGVKVDRVQEDEPPYALAPDPPLDVCPAWKSET